MLALDVVKSTVDDVRKYIFNIRGQETEFTYINKDDGKDIIVCPSQTSCKLGCTFCHLTGLDLPVLNLTSEEICAGIETVVSAENLGPKPLLISFMGSGEPLCNLDAVLSACRAWASEDVRFAISTMLPSYIAIAKLMTTGLPIKVHLSLHSTWSHVRQELMPACKDPRNSLLVLQAYRVMTGNPVEIHYTLIDGVNDGDSELYRLASWLKDTNITLKLLDFKPRDKSLPSQKAARFAERLRAMRVQVEEYNPPGSDIGSSCGQFIR